MGRSIYILCRHVPSEDGGVGKSMYIVRRCVPSEAGSVEVAHRQWQFSSSNGSVSMHVPALDKRSTILGHTIVIMDAFTNV